MAEISLINVTKTFSSRQVLYEVSLDINDGEFLVVVGPSGCGKSTLLRIVAGLESCTDGQLLMDNQVVNSWPPHERNIGMVFQNYALYPHLSVFENLSFGLVAHKVPKAEIQERVRQVAELLEISSLLKEKPKTLSGGQRQRVAVGRALVRQPRVFLMDEPLSNLDALLRERMRVELRKLHEQLRIATLYVTHDQTEAMTLADRIAVMRDGHVLQVGSPEEVYHTPSTKFVAQFLGSPPMNVVRVQTNYDGIVYPVGHPNEKIYVPDAIRTSWDNGVDENGTIWLGFRPESVSQKRDIGSLELELNVDTVESLGARFHAHGAWGGQGLTLVTEDNEGWSRGAKVRVQIPWKSVHWFDGKSERRIEQAQYSQDWVGGVRSI